MKRFSLLITVLLIFFFSACEPKNDGDTNNSDSTVMNVNLYQVEVEKYFEFELNTDLSYLSDNQKEMLKILFEVADIMNELQWQVAAGTYRAIYDTLTDPYAKQLFIINYGPWNRLDGNKPFIDGVGDKPLGAFFYPEDMTQQEFENLNDDTKDDLYTVIRRETNGNLISVPYHEAFKTELEQAAELLRTASDLADDAGFKKYLSLRADALVTDDYFKSDMAWMDMSDNMIEFVVGPIENYEDGLFEYKAAFEAFILIKDMDWSAKLAKYAALLPQLQKLLPVPDEYKQEEPGSNSQLNAYDAIYYAGDCNAGSKTIAINLPNDENVQLAKGSRRLQLKNSMKAKFENIVVPIAGVLINPDQKNLVTFDAFFANTMFHEVAHGLGAKNLINGSGVTCRDAIKDRYSTLEEGKADILGLWLINQLVQMNEYDGNFSENQVTFVTSIFRSIRFGASSSHGKANLIRYNFFMEQGAITRDANGIYTINEDQMKLSSDNLANIILTIQGDGDYDRAGELMDKYMVITPELEADLQRLADANIPVDVVWKQGVNVVGL
ncbi:MAG: Zn-dependent hydrolase [Bacteroidales bacterium]|nr:Zn-dependent hydrolase [Bacteroidales bacterium]